MSSRNHHQANRSASSLGHQAKSPVIHLGRRRRARRAQALVEILEPRRLLSTYTFPDQSTPQANATELQGIIIGTTQISGHTLTSGDTLQISPSDQFIFQGGTGNTTTLTIPDRTDFAIGSAPITIETLASLPAGRINPTTQGTNLVQFLGNTPSEPIIDTAASAHDFTFIGIEVAPYSATNGTGNGGDLVEIGNGTSVQNSPSLVPTNFVFDQCYITGLDYSPAANNNYIAGIELQSSNTTVENCNITNIHNNGKDCYAIGGYNGLGNFTITNNFLEASGENIIFGGATGYLGTGISTSNILITHNYFFKPLSWDSSSPLWDGNHYDVKNLLEFKQGAYVNVEYNLFQNCFVGADQVAEAICITPKGYGDYWALDHDITVTNNVIENVGEGIQFAADAPDTDGGYTQPAYNIDIDNNLFEDIQASAAGASGTGYAFIVEGGEYPGYNVTFENNTAFSSVDDLFMDATSTFGDAISTGFVFINNVGFNGAGAGIFSSFGDGTKALNGGAPGVTMTNVGVGYTAVPTVTFTGGGGTGATGTAILGGKNDTSPNSVVSVDITNNGSGYTSNPTITFTGGGYTTLATATATEVNGIVCGWTFAGNVIIGIPSGDVSEYPNSGYNTNYYDTSVQDSAGFLDPAGDEYGFLSTSAYHDKGTDGNNPGVNMSDLSGIADFVPADTTLQNYWKFDETSGTTATDVGLGAEHNGTLSSSGIRTTSGEMNGAIALTGGTSGSVSVANFVSDANFTFAAWINPGTFTNGTSYYIASAANAAFSLFVNGSGKLEATTSNGATATAASALASGWSLISVSYNSTTDTLTLYQDGVSIASGTTTGSIASGSTTLYIGDSGGTGSSFNGTIDDVRYYSSAISGVENIAGYANLVPGSGYSTNTAGFTVTFSGGGGTGAVATAYANTNGAITYISFDAPGDSYGSGYTSAPTMSFTNGSGTGASAHTAMYDSPMAYLYAGFAPLFGDAGGGLNLISTSTTAMTAFALGHADDNNAAPMSYLWSEYSGPAGVTFSTNNSNAAQHTTVTWPTSGSYVLEITVTDGLGSSNSFLYTRTVNLGAPAVPTLTGVSPSGTNNVVTWTWSQGSGTAETGFDVFVSQDDDYDGIQVGPTQSSSATSFTDTSETPGTQYYYYVEAVNTNGPSADSNILGIVDGSPAAPSNLAAVGTPTEISLTWTDNSTNESGFQIWRSTDGVNFGNTAYHTTPANTTSYNDTTVSGTTTYYYYVESYDGDGASIPSNTITAQLLTAPTAVMATPIASSQISVSWTDTFNGASFNVEYENANGGSWSSPISVPVGTTSYIVTTGLSADTQYNFQVQAYTASSSSNWSAPGDGRTFSTAGSPTVYEGFNYPVVAGNSTNLVGLSGGVGWSGAWGAYEESGSSEYYISSPGMTYSNLVTTGNSFNSQDAGNGVRTLASAIPDTAGTTVWASVMVEDQSTTGNGYVELLGNNTSGGTNNVEFGFPNGDFSITIPSVSNWGSTAPVENDTYLLVLEIAYGSSNTLNMYIDPDPTQSSSSWTAYQSVTTSAQLNNVDSAIMVGSTAGKENTWDELRIGLSAASVVPMIVPNAPTNLTASPSGTNIALAWTTSNSSSSIVQGYDVWRSSNSGTTWTEAATGLANTTTSYTDTSVTAGTTYTYEVTAENTTGDSINSNIVSLGAGGTKPAEPSNLAAVPGTNSIVLTWKNNATNATSFTIQRSTDDATWSTTWTGISSTVTTFTDTTPSSGVIYYYQIEAVNGAGDSAFDGLPSNCGVATVYAYEGFNYPTTSAWNGSTTGGNLGVGFTGNWSISSSVNASVVSGNLNYNKNGDALTTSGNSITLATSANATDTLSSSIGQSGTTLWVGFEFDSTSTATYAAQVYIGVPSNRVMLGLPWNADINARAQVGTYNDYMSSTDTVVANQTYFMVYEIQYLTGGDVVTMYIDPQPGGTSPTNYTDKITMTLPSADQLTPTSTVELVGAPSPYVTTFDELRLGASYGSVAPDPKLTSGTGNSGTASKRRPSRGGRATPFLSSVPIHNHFAPSDTITQKAKTSAPPFYPGLGGGPWHWVDDTDNNALFDVASNSANGSWQGLFN